MKSIEQMFNNAEAKAVSEKVAKDAHDRTMRLYDDLTSNGHSEQEALEITLRMISATKCFVNEDNKNV